MIEKHQLDFDTVEPTPVAQTGQREADSALIVGSKVYLKGAPFGEPGRVVRIERGKLAVLWADLGPSYIGRHSPDSLMLAESKAGGGR